MARIAILFVSIFLAYSECCTGMCHHLDKSFKNDVILIHEDTIGCCNAEKIFIVAQELEDSTIIYNGNIKKYLSRMEM